MNTLLAGCFLLMGVLGLVAATICLAQHDTDGARTMYLFAITMMLFRLDVKRDREGGDTPCSPNLKS